MPRLCGYSTPVPEDRVGRDEAGRTGDAAAWAAEPTFIGINSRVRGADFNAAPHADPIDRAERHQQRAIIGKTDHFADHAAVVAGDDFTMIAGNTSDNKINGHATGSARVRCPTDCIRTNADVTNMSSIRASARIIVERFGDGAVREARRRAEELLAARNYPARTRWQLISREAEKILAGQQN